MNRPHANKKKHIGNERPNQSCAREGCDQEVPQDKAIARDGWVFCSDQCAEALGTSDPTKACVDPSDAVKDARE